MIQKLARTIVANFEKRLNHINHKFAESAYRTPQNTGKRIYFPAKNKPVIPSKGQPAEIPPVLGIEASPLMNLALKTLEAKKTEQKQEVTTETKMVAATSNKDTIHYYKRSVKSLVKKLKKSGYPLSKEQLVMVRTACKTLDPRK